MVGFTVTVPASTGRNGPVALLIETEVALLVIQERTIVSPGLKVVWFAESSWQEGVDPPPPGGGGGVGVVLIWTATWQCTFPTAPPMRVMVPT